MLYFHKKAGSGNDKTIKYRAPGSRAAAVLLAAVTVLSPLSVQGMTQSGCLYAAENASEASASASGTAQTAETSATAGTASPAETADSTAASTAAETAAEDSENGQSAEASTAAAAENPENADTSESAAPLDSADSPDSSADVFSQGEEDGGIRVHLAGAPDDPVPQRTMDLDTASLLRLVTEGLTVLDENNEPAPGCAESWEVSEDGLKWTFHLRKELKWSDGSSMEASDFVTLFMNLADTSREALYGQYLTQNIAGYEDVLNGDVTALQVRAEDKNTFSVNLLTPDPDFARLCASWSLLPIREQIQEDADDAPPADWNKVTGNGPYYIDSVDEGREFVLKKNPWYRNSDTSDNSQTAFDIVHWIIDGDVNEEYSAFLNGEMDAVSEIPEEEEKILEAGNLVHKTSLPDTMGICFNCRHEALADARVRRALSMSVDRTFIASEILQDVYLPESADGRGNQGLVEDDMSEAKKLLEEAGYKNGEGIPVLSCIAGEDGGALLTAEYLASVWKDLGIEVWVEAVGAKDLAQEKTAGTFDIFCGSIYLPSDLPAAELAAFATDNENNISGFSSEQYDLLFEKASGTSDEKEYKQAMEQAFDILKEEVPMAPLATRCVSWLCQDQYPGIKCDSTGCWQLLDTAAGAAGGQTSGNAAGVRSFIPETEDDAGQEESPLANPANIAVMQTGRHDAAAAPKPGSRFGSGTYFTITDETAYLTGQAWVLEKSGDDMLSTVSLPKYSEVHVTGKDNPAYVRIVRDGKIYFLENSKVTADASVLDGLRAREEEYRAEKDVLTASMHSVKENELEDRAADVRARTEEIQAAIAHREMLRKQTRNPNWDGPVLSRGNGSVMGPSGKETYYNLNMSGVVSIMRRMGNTDEYWVRDDGCKMLGDYIMCAANLSVHPRGSLVESSLGTCIVCDTGGFASHNSHQIDIAVTW